MAIDVRAVYSEPVPFIPVTNCTCQETKSCRENHPLSISKSCRNLALRAHYCHQKYLNFCSKGLLREYREEGSGKKFLSPPRFRSKVTLKGNEGPVIRLGLVILQFKKRFPISPIFFLPASNLCLLLSASSSRPSLTSYHPDAPTSLAPQACILLALKSVMLLGIAKGDDLTAVATQDDVIECSGTVKPWLTSHPLARHNKLQFSKLYILL
jgi:hypothetical protein